MLAGISGKDAVPRLEGIERLELVVDGMSLHLVEDLLPFLRRLAAVGKGGRILLEPGWVDARRERDLLELARLDARGAHRIGQGKGEQRLAIQHADDPFGEGEADQQRHDDQQRVRERGGAAFSRGGGHAAGLIADAIASANKAAHIVGHDTRGHHDGRCLRRAGRTPAGEAFRHAGPAAVRHGCDSEPRADVGPCLQHPGRDVRRGRHAGRPRRPARLLSRLRRIQGEPLDVRRAGTGPVDERGALPRRAHPDRPPAALCRRAAAREPDRRRGLRRRLLRGGCRSGRSRGGPARAPRPAGLRVPGGRRPHRLASVSPDRQADARRPLQVRPQQPRRAQEAARCRRRLCRRRPRGAC